MKGLLDTELYVELMRWAHILDDLVIRDSVDFIRSKAVERVGRYLFGMELALRPVSHAMQLDRANWAAVKVLDLGNNDTDISAGVRKLCMQARRAASRRARLNRLAKKFAGLEGTATWDIAMQQMKAAWSRDWIDIKTPMKKKKRRSPSRNLELA